MFSKSGLICAKCHDRIFSFYRHDMRYCKCGKSFIDGGHDYMRCGGIIDNEPACWDNKVDPAPIWWMIRYASIIEIDESQIRILKDIQDRPEVKVREQWILDEVLITIGIKAEREKKQSEKNA